MADHDRARSFIERYVIERARSFRPGFEKEDGHTAALEGRTIYRGIAGVAKMAEPTEPVSEGSSVWGPTQGAVGAMGPPGVMGPPGATGMQGPMGPLNPPLNTAPFTGARQPVPKKPSAKVKRWFCG